MRLTPRSGFTLVEVLIAALIADLGLLAFVGSSALLVRRHTAARLGVAASQAATTRVEQLAVAACTATAGTASRPDGLRETWSAAPIGNGGAELADSVSYVVAGIERSIVVRTRVGC